MPGPPDSRGHLGPRCASLGSGLRRLDQRRETLRRLRHVIACSLTLDGLNHLRPRHDMRDRLRRDLDGLARLQRTRDGFGALRAAREPLPICRSAVERTFVHRGAATCVNPDFLLSGAGAVYSVTVSRRVGDPQD